MLLNNFFILDDLPEFYRQVCFIYGLLIYFEYWNVILFLLGLSFDALRDGLFWSYIIE